MKDIITGLNGRQYQRRDLGNDWQRAFNLGKADSGENFAVDALLGGTDRRGNWDSVDRLKFSLKDNLHLELNTDPKVITELVRFENGTPSVVGSVEYGDSLSLDLAPGDYGLSFFVEGDLTSYQVSGTFL
jgi:hypothetical protein